jgi:hypothetical protein
MSISCFATVYLVVFAYKWAQRNMLNLTWCMHMTKCMWNIGMRYQNYAQWILVHNARVVHVSCQCDEEEMNIRYRCVVKCFTL